MPSRSFYYIFILFAFVSLLSSCEFINPDEDTPAYLKINNIVLAPARQGSGTFGNASSKITDVWLFANGKEIGTFSLPATIPLLEKGDVRLDIQAGVYIDGLKGNRIKYVFMEQKQLTVAMEPAKTTTLDTVKVNYRSNIQHPFFVYDDFTGGPSNSSGMRVANGSPYQLQVNRDSLTGFAYANGWVGVVYGLPGNTERIFLESAYNGWLPANGSPVFLEFDYKSTMNFEVGLAVNLPNQPLGETRDKEIIVAKSSSWNRMYLELTNEVNKPGYRSGEFKVIMEGIPSGKPNEYLAIDNVRLIHYPR